MPRQITTTVYQYAELSDDAKAKARYWYRQANSDDTFWSESVTDDFKLLLSACGFQLERDRSNHDALYWSGFAHQGQGACFGAHWSTSLIAISAINQLLIERPSCDANNSYRVCLHAAESLKAKFPHGYGDVEARERTMSSRVDSVCVDGLEEYSSEERQKLQDQLQDLVDDLAHYFFQSLEREYDYRQSDACVAEDIEANEYEFTEEGQRA